MATETDPGAVLAALGALGRELAAAAAAEDWPRVLELDERRAGLLAALPLDGRADVRTALEEALALTRELLERAEGARTAVGAELRGLRRGQRGANAYHGSG